jgi:hypothetical protein
MINLAAIAFVEKCLKPTIAYRPLGNESGQVTVSVVQAFATAAVVDVPRMVRT